MYPADVEEHTLLGDVVAGRTTFKESLETVVEELKQVPAKIKKSDGECLDRFDELLGLVDVLSEEELNTADLRNTAKMIFGFKYMRKTAFKNAAFSAVGGVLSYLPFVAPAGWIVMLYTWMRFTKYSFGTVYSADAVKNPEKALAPLYAAANSLDASDIDSRFVFDLFNSSRPRFEGAYTALPSKEREAVDGRLYGLLGVGGIKDMDELELGDYLSGLVVQEADPAFDSFK